MLKGLAAKAFSPSAIAAARPGVETHVDELLDRLSRSGHMDVIADFAYPLPADAISAMVGVPREDWAMLRGFVDGVILSRGIVRTAAMMAEGDRSARLFMGYLRAGAGTPRAAANRSDERDDRCGRRRAPAQR